MEEGLNVWEKDEGTSGDGIRDLNNQRFSHRACCGLPGGQVRRLPGIENPQVLRQLRHGEKSESK